MRNPRPIVARLVRGPLAGATKRVQRDQDELHYALEDSSGGKTRFRTHVYRIKWPKDETPAVVVANYVGTRRR